MISSGNTDIGSETKNVFVGVLRTIRAVLGVGVIFGFFRRTPPLGNPGTHRAGIIYKASIGPTDAFCGFQKRPLRRGVYTQ